MTSKRKLEIEKTAVKTRQKAAITGDGIVDIFDVCQALGYYSVRYPLGAESVLGAVIMKNDDFIIFSNSSSILSREIFTVAHEIGHIELQHLNNTFAMIDEHTQGCEENELEKEANYFAACFLMPLEKLSAFMRINIGKSESALTVLDIANVQSIFNTSFETTLNRLETLGLIDIQKKEELLKEKSDRKVSNLLRAVGGPTNLCVASEIKSVPIEFLHWVVYNYEKQLIPKETLVKALEYLDLNMDDVGVSEVIDKDDDFFDLDEFLGGEN